MIEILRKTVLFGIGTVAIIGEELERIVKSLGEKPPLSKEKEESSEETPPE